MDPFPSRACSLAALLLFSLCLTSCDNPLAQGEKPWTGMWSPGDSVDNPGYKPDQPIHFDHSLHVGKNQMDCQYCHSGARHSPVAGVPSMNTCMGCHKFVKTDTPAIKLLTDHYNRNEAIEWTKVHDLPDFVKFTHEAHIHKFKERALAESPDADIHSKEFCLPCHGEVEKMDIVEQVAPLSMGWCIDCHVQNDAPTSCNTCHF